MNGIISPVNLGTLGSLLIFLGIFLGCFNRIYKGVLSERDKYANHLRSEGRNLRADRIDAESKLIKRRMPLYGKCFVFLGVVLVVGAALAAWS